MSETKTHTPGPWRVEASGPQSQGDWHFWDVVGPNGRIATVSAVAQRGPVDMDANEANARLVAAAPAMAEALRRARDMLQSIAGDIEDGYSLAEMRGKYVLAVLGARDACHSALALSRGEKPE